MKTNNGWIKTDYKVQTAFGWGIASMIVCGTIGLLISQSAYLILCLALLLLIPIGAWQVLSGLIYALNGDRLQQIYLGVVAIYFGIWFVTPDLVRDYFPLVFFIAFIIAVWKYTVVRADYISLKIIDVPKTDDNTLLDA